MAIDRCFCADLRQENTDMPSPPADARAGHEQLSLLDLDRHISAVENIASLFSLVSESPDFAGPECRGLSWLADRLTEEANDLRRAFDGVVAPNVTHPS
jgi:hypothetical protein